jgi:hypothetical protein
MKCISWVFEFLDRTILNRFEPLNTLFLLKIEIRLVRMLCILLCCWFIYRYIRIIYMRNSPQSILTEQLATQVTVFYWRLFSRWRNVTYRWFWQMDNSHGRKCEGDIIIQQFIAHQLQLKYSVYTGISWLFSFFMLCIMTLKPWKDIIVTFAEHCTTRLHILCSGCKVI